MYENKRFSLLFLHSVEKYIIYLGINHILRPQTFGFSFFLWQEISWICISHMNVRNFFVLFFLPIVWNHSGLNIVLTFVIQIAKNYTSANTRVICDRVRNRKKYFEIPAFLPIELSRAGRFKVMLHFAATEMFCFHLMFWIFPLMIFLVQSAERREFQNIFSCSVPYHI